VDKVDEAGEKIKGASADIGKATADKVEAVGNATTNTAKAAREKIE